MELIKNILVTGCDDRFMATDICFLKNKLRKPLIVYIHGFNGFKDWGNFDLIAKEFANAGFLFIKMNLSHNGTTPESPDEFVDLEAYGQNNFSKELIDIEKIIDWVCDPLNAFHEELNLNRIVLLGHSRGGGVAILKAFEDKRVSALITWASIAEAKTPWGNMSEQKLEHWKQEGVFYYHNKRTNQKLPICYQLYEDYLRNEKRFDIQQGIKNLAIPILICHGRQDDAVPYEKALTLKKWQPNAKLFSVESDHVFGRKHPWNEPGLPQAMQEVVNESIRTLLAWQNEGLM